MFSVHAMTSADGRAAAVSHLASPGSSRHEPHKPWLITGAGSARDRRLTYACPGRAVSPPCVMDVPK